MEITGTMPQSIIKVNGQHMQAQDDLLAIEEPLQIMLQLHSATGRINKNVAVTMRTPGNDHELAAGFLFTEAIINNNGQLSNIFHSVHDENNIVVQLKENVLPSLHKTERNFYATSSCGVCGKTSIDAIRMISPFHQQSNQFSVTADVLYTLQDTLRSQQLLFENTGGLHAVALFDTYGKLLLMREDVGRHNALDKLIGALLLNNELPLPGKILLLSGRASFELVQKATMAGIQMIVAVGAPSSLAVELANENDITLVGFLRKERFNIYCGEHRIKL